MQIMKVLTVWQPWASLIAIEAKPYEFRGWRPPNSLIGTRIAIHAAARPMKLQELRKIESGLLGEGDEINPCLNAEIALPAIRKIMEALLYKPGHDDLFEPAPAMLPYSHIVCTAVVGEPKSGDECAREFGDNSGNDSDREGTFNWGWPMLDVKIAEPPIPARGQQGIWNFNGIPADLT